MPASSADSASISGSIVTGCLQASQILRTRRCAITQFSAEMN
jgi:hypothetical protein